MAQLDRLLAVLDLDQRHHVLDVGCGAGLISEYVSDVTKASVTGVDVAQGAIERARKRSAGKRQRLAFRVNDVDSPSLPGTRFDTIICVDALQFVESKSMVMLRLKRALKDGGQMGILWPQWLDPGGSRERLLPGGTDLVKAIKRTGLRFRFWDLTPEFCGFLERYARVAEELRPAFEAEGNAELGELKVSEGRAVAKYVEDGRVKRYLYHLRLGR